MFSVWRGSVDLYICRTPFQAFICSKIIAQKSACEYEVLYISPSSGKVHINYYSKLAEGAISSEFFVASEGLGVVGKVVENTYLLYTLRRIYKGRCYGNVYISSIDSVLVQVVISLVSLDRLVSFDDGSANYNYRGNYYSDKEAGFGFRLLGRLFGNVKTKARVIAEIEEHYAIDASKRNIVDRVKPIQLGFSEGKNKHIGGFEKTRCCVIIGCIYEVISENPRKLIEDAITHLSFCDYYIPHPRYKKSPITGIKVLDGAEICEEKILNILDQFDSVDVYSFGSTALMTLAGVPRIRLILVRSKNIKDWPYVRDMESVVDEVLWI